MAGDALRNIELTASIHIGRQPGRPKGMATDSFFYSYGAGPGLDQSPYIDSRHMSGSDEFPILGKSREEGHGRVAIEPGFSQPFVNSVSSQGVHGNFIEVAALLLQPEPANTFSLVVVLNLKRNDG